MGVTPVYGWRLPDGGIAADGPDAFADLAIDIETTLSAPGWNSYVPAWYSGGSQQPSNPAVKLGRYRLANGWCDFSVFMTFGPSSGGGKGPLYVGLPVAASSQLPEQVGRIKLWMPSTGNFPGTAVISANASATRMMMCYSPDNCTEHDWSSADESGQPGTGVPRLAGRHPVENGGNIGVSGRYLVA